LNTIKFILEVIQNDIIVGFALYSILFFISLFFISNKSKIKEFDKHACKVVVYLGLIYLLLSIFGEIYYYFTTTEIKKLQFENIIFGKYWYEYLMNLLLPILLLQLLRVNLFNSFLVFRLIISFVFALTISKIAIFIAAYNSYMSFGETTSVYEYFSNFSIELSVFEIIYNLLFKILFFIIIVLLFAFLGKIIRSKMK
jgi:hypothetical protein